jgi:uncharacterized protein (DUF927 family)
MMKFADKKSLVYNLVNKILFKYWTTYDYYYNSLIVTLLNHNFLFLFDKEIDLDILYILRKQRHHTGQYGLVVKQCILSEKGTLRNILNNYSRYFEKSICLANESKKNRKLVQDRFNRILDNRDIFSIDSDYKTNIKNM